MKTWFCGIGAACRRVRRALGAAALFILGSVTAAATVAVTSDGPGSFQGQVTYDPTSLQAGQAVQVNLTVYTPDGFEHIGVYNRSWEGGNGNFSVTADRPMGYGIIGQGSYLPYTVWVTPNAVGTFRVGIFVSRFPDYVQSHAYIDFTATSPGAPPSAILPAGRLVKRREYVNFNVSASGTAPITYAASGMIPSLAMNSVGNISGWVETPYVPSKQQELYSTVISASNSLGSATPISFTWAVDQPDFTPDVRLVPSSPMEGATVDLQCYSRARFGVSWTETTIWKPSGPPIALGNLQPDFIRSFVANVPGTYWIQHRIVDIYGNSNLDRNGIDHWQSFVVAENPDRDGDGIPNAIENQIGSNDAANDALVSRTADGFSNVAKYNLNITSSGAQATTGAFGGATPADWNSLATPDTSRLDPQTNQPYAVGVTTGELAVGAGGAATYSIPIWTSPGTAGMEPKLALSYSSQAGAGIAGYGWSLSGLSAISRGPQTRRVDNAVKGVTLTNDDRFYLDGQRLICLGSNNGADGAEYRTEIDGLSRIASFGNAGGGPEFFRVWSKAGLVTEYGRSATSRLAPQNGSVPLNWSVSRIYDTVGNYIEFTYTVDATSGEQLLTKVSYAGQENGRAPYASLCFEYESRPDTSFGFVVGKKVSRTQRLAAIKARVGTTTVRTYALGYTLRQPTERSLLISVKETGADGRSLPPLAFGYSEAVLGWDPAPGFLLPDFLADNQNTTAPATGTGFVDLNGDGRPDFVRRKGTEDSGAVYLNTGAGWTPAPTNAWQLPHPLAGSASAIDTGARFVDLNGDGRIDFIWGRVDSSGNTPSGETSGAMLNTGTGWQPANQYAPPTPIARDNEPLRSGRFVDVDGDGRVDFISFLPPASAGDLPNLAVYRNTGGGWEPMPHAGYSAMPENIALGKAQFIEVSGDGLVDIVMSYHGSGVTLRSTYLNTGGGWVLSPAYQSPALLADNVHPAVGTEFSDVNGDGLPDLIWYREIGGSNTRGVALNTGAGWFTACEGNMIYEPGDGSTSVDSSCLAWFTLYAPPSPLARDGASTPGTAQLDLNADGMPDLTLKRYFSNGGTSAQTHYGNFQRWVPAGGTGTHDLPSGVNLYTQGQAASGIDFVDVNGDGSPDLLFRRKNADGSAPAENGAWLNRSRNADRLISAINALGVTVGVEYRSLVEPTVYDPDDAYPSPPIRRASWPRPTWSCACATTTASAASTTPFTNTAAVAPTASTAVRGSGGCKSTMSCARPTRRPRLRRVFPSLACPSKPVPTFCARPSTPTARSPNPSPSMPPKT